MNAKIELMFSDVLCGLGVTFCIGFLVGAVPFFLAWLFCRSNDLFVLRWFMDRANKQHERELERDE